uniref:Uncharacterized protein n=1 Tax=Amphimedon queenslandica TaxID=400682 RepID=A0A1X7SU63_AMPQE
MTDGVLVSQEEAFSQGSFKTFKTFVYTFDNIHNAEAGATQEEIGAAPLFYEQVLPAVTNMLQSHTTIRLLRIDCEDINKKSSQPNWIEIAQHLYETIFIHPSLEYIGIYIEHPVMLPYFPAPTLLEDTLKDQKKTLIDRHRKEQPHKPLPIVVLT